VRELFGSPLPLPKHTRYDELGVSPDASNEDVRWAKLEAVSRLRGEDRSLEAEARQKAEDINQWNLDKPDARLVYDCAHPPLALLKLAPPADAALRDPRTFLFLLRSAISEFLNAHGEEVFHPSDVTRRDFTDDFDHHELLDGRHAAPS
jgi:hypothetical protein